MTGAGWLPLRQYWYRYEVDPETPKHRCYRCAKLTNTCVGGERREKFRAHNGAIVTKPPVTWKLPLCLDCFGVLDIQRDQVPEKPASEATPKMHNEVGMQDLL